MLSRPAPSSARVRRPAPKAGFAALALALVLHAWLLGGADAAMDSGATAFPSTARPNAEPVRVRRIDAAPPAVAFLAPADAERNVAEPPRRAAETAPSAATARRQVAGAPRPGRSDASRSRPSAAAQAAGASAAGTGASPAAVDPDAAVPVYRTALPPAVTLHYQLRRGGLSGSGELRWKPEAQHYEARLEGSVAGVPVLTQVSTGDIDAHGIAPLRYTDQRARQASNAANFQRDKGKITYSGPQLEYPLLAGAQDRLSWMVQLAAVLKAEPHLAAPGGKIVLFVSGARGDADVWVFRFDGVEPVRWDGSVTPAVRFTREPRQAYDRRVDVWLACERHCLPVRARLSAEAGGDVFELLLRDMQFP